MQKQILQGMLVRTFVEIDEMLLPLNVAKKEFPAQLPSGHRLLILQKSSNRREEGTSGRYFSVNETARFRLMDPNMWGPDSDVAAMTRFCQAGKAAIFHSFVIYNHKHTFPLLPNSKEFVGGKWIACEVVAYDP